MADNPKIESNNENQNTSPGQLLKAQREKQSLSAGDIAKRVHLDIKVIEAIEIDDYKNMPSAIYVRGYLRSYAKIVAADVETIISLYNSDSPPPPEILPEVKPPTQASSNDKPVKAFTYLVSLGLVLLLLVWYQSNFVVTPQNNQIKKAPEGANTINGADTSIDGIISGGMLPANTINGLDTSIDTAISPEEWQTPAPPVTADSVKNTEKSIQGETLELQTDNGEETIEIIPIEGIDNQPDPPAVTGQDSIVLSLSHDSWIKIVDANNKILFHDLALANEQHAITGITPFHVLLGFSEGVTIKFNGESFDQSPYSNNSIARFILPIP